MGSSNCAGRAAAGDCNTAREIREATEGKAAVSHEVAGTNGQPLQLPSLVVHFVDSGTEAVPRKKPAKYPRDEGSYCFEC